MPIYFSSNQIPELKAYSIKERQEFLAKARNKLTIPEKLILNIIKLIMLVPPFIFLARLEWFLFFLSLVLVTLIYLTIMNPIYLSFIYRHLKQYKLLTPGKI